MRRISRVFGIAVLLSLAACAADIGSGGPALENLPVYSQSEIDQDVKNLSTIQSEAEKVGFRTTTLYPTSSTIETRWDQDHLKWVAQNNPSLTLLEAVTVLKRYQDALEKHISKYARFKKPDGSVQALKYADELRATLDLTKKTVEKLKAENGITDEQVAAKMAGKEPQTETKPIDAVGSGSAAVKTSGNSSVTPAPGPAPVENRNVPIADIKNHAFKLEVIDAAKFNQLLAAGLSLFLQNGKTASQYRLDRTSNLCYLEDTGIGTVKVGDQVFMANIRESGQKLLGISNDLKVQMRCLKLKDSYTAWNVNDLDQIFQGVAKVITE
ncbi:MAG: hypothetical protein RJB38_1587 [Pseudomonadota bacterium]|jgi:hypothetical protein